MLPKLNAKKENSLTEEINNLVQTIIDFIGNLFNQPVSLDEFVNKFSDKTDEIILGELQKGSRYGGGRFYVKSQNEDTFECSFELYFETKEKEYIKMEGDKKDIPLRYLADTDRVELKQKKTIVFEIDEPNDDNASENKIKKSSEKDDITESSDTENKTEVKTEIKLEGL